MKRNSHPVIGLTGLTCSGKSLVAGRFHELGAHVIDVDKVGHAVLEDLQVTARVAERFGEAILAANGTVDRRRLGKLVFSDPQALSDLEAIVHPLMRERVQSEAATHCQDQPVVIDAALLHPIGLDTLCSAIFVVESPLTLRQERAAGRGWETSECSRRDERLIETMERIREEADCVLDNSSSPESLTEFATRIWKEWNHATQEES